MSQICSGDKISLETDDPVFWPPPAFMLLEMQCFLHCVTATSAAAGPEDDFYDKDNDKIMLALQDRFDMYTEDDWEMVIDEAPAMESL